MRQNRDGKGFITRYLIKVISFSNAQTKQLIRQYVTTGKAMAILTRGNGFKPTTV
jgi:hypothetical protein